MTERRCDVLIAEDDGVIREQLAELLRAHGYSVAEAANGLEALEYLRTAEAGVLLVDLMMPMMNGLELLKELKTQAATQPPTLIITAFPNTASSVGAPVFLKPLNVPSLVRAVRAYLGDRNTPTNVPIAD